MGTSGTPRTALLKLSGEALAGESGYGIDTQAVRTIAAQVVAASQAGVRTALVIGGGNIWRGIGKEADGFDKVQADYMGMLATVINAMAFQTVLENLGADTRVLSAINLQQLAEPYIRRRAVRHLEKGRIVLFAGGTGNPYFTTDSAAALRAIEIGADVVLKATKVDGVYSADPAKDPDATRYTTLSYQEVLAQRLQVMDATAISLCMENHLPIVVFDMRPPDQIRRALLGERLGTLVGGP